MTSLFWKMYSMPCLIASNVRSLGRFGSGSNRGNRLVKTNAPTCIAVTTK